MFSSPPYTASKNACTAAAGPPPLDDDSLLSPLGAEVGSAAPPPQAAASRATINSSAIGTIRAIFIKIAPLREGRKAVKTDMNTVSNKYMFVNSHPVKNQ